MAKISNKEIALAIYSALRGKKGTELKSALESVIHFLSRRRLLSQTGQILSHLQKIEDKESGILRIKLESTHSAGTNLKRQLKKILEKRYRVKEVIFDEKVKPELLGGVRLETEDEVIDLSLKGKINRLKEHLTA